MPQVKTATKYRILHSALTVGKGEMKFSTLKYQAGNRIARITLNRPDRLNAVNERMPREYQGRVFAAQVVLTNLASIPPILLAGLLTTLLGPQLVLASTMIVLAAVALWAVAQASLRSPVNANG